MRRFTRLLTGVAAIAIAGVGTAGAQMAEPVYVDRDDMSYNDYAHNVLAVYTGPNSVESGIPDTEAYMNHRCYVERGVPDICTEMFGPFANLWQVMSNGQLDRLMRDSSEYMVDYNDNTARYIDHTYGWEFDQYNTGYTEAEMENNAYYDFYGMPYTRQVAPGVYGNTPGHSYLSPYRPNAVYNPQRGRSSATRQPMTINGYVLQGDQMVRTNDRWNDSEEFNYDNLTQSDFENWTNEDFDHLVESSMYREDALYLENVFSLLEKFEDVSAESTIVSDADSLEDAEFDLREYVSHPCYNQVGIEHFECAELFGPYTDLRGMLVSGELTDLISEHLDPIYDVTFLMQAIERERERIQDMQNWEREADTIFDGYFRNTREQRAAVLWEYCKELTDGDARGFPNTAGQCFQDNFSLIERLQEPLTRENIHVRENY